MPPGPILEGVLGNPEPFPPLPVPASGSNDHIRYAISFKFHVHLWNNNLTGVL